MDEPLLGLLVGIIQGVFEWLPVSSEGIVSIVLTGLDVAADEATTFALVLHVGTALAATVYYRDVLGDLLRRVPSWRPASAFEGDSADLSFYVLATLASGLTGMAGYLALEEVTTALAGGAFLALIGLLLLVTGVLLWIGEQEEAEQSDDGPGTGGRAGGIVTARSDPTAGDAVLVGLLQGFAVLPGISRSGTTISALLLRGHEGPAALQFSFVLSIPAAVGAGLVAYVQSGLPTISPAGAGIAILTSAVVGYATVDGLTRVANRLAFSRICVGFGVLAIVGGLLVIV